MRPRVGIPDGSPRADPRPPLGAAPASRAGRLLGVARARRFAPPDLPRQAIEAEEAGVDGICCSDHLAAVVDASHRADVVGQRLGLARRRAHATSCAALGPAVTALVHRYNPVVVAQQAATLEALEIVVRLLDGETVDFEGRFFRARGAVLHHQPQRRPPVYMSAFYEGAAEVAGRLADGIWTLGDPRRAPRVIAAYRRSCERHGREPGEVILQTLFSWADDDEAALEAAREWRGTLVDANYTDDVHDPAEIERLGEEEVSDRKLKAMTIVSSDPSSHVNRIKLLEGMGATIVALMNVSGADPHGALGVYGREILPELRA